MKLDNQTLEVIFVGLVALALITQAFILLAALIVMRKTAKSIGEKLDTFGASAIPLIDKTRTLVNNLSPRIEGAADDVAALTHSLRRQTADLQSLSNEIVMRTRAQATRLDGMMTGVLDSVERAGNFVTDTVNKPLRQLSAILASIKAAVESLRDYQAPPRADAERASRDHDMFV